MKHSNKQRLLIALCTTISVHSLLLVLLYWLSLERLEQSTEKQELILVEMGQTSYRGEAMISPAPLFKTSENNLTSPPESSSQSSEQTAPKLNTQNHEPSLKLSGKEVKTQKPSSKPKSQQLAQAKVKQEEERRKRLEEEARIKREKEAKHLAEEQAKRKEQASRSVAQAFAVSQSKDQSGDGSSQEGQGVSIGQGSSFNLDGRHIVSNGGKLISPKTHKAIEGRIVVQIIVDSRGVVTSAYVLPKGTNITDAKIRTEAIKAAEQTSFNPLEGTNSQKGTITYIYIIKT